jgi:hypothetical protein
MEESRVPETVVAICVFCGERMAEGASCSEEPLLIGDSLYTPIRWGDEEGYPFRIMTERCGDCSVGKGGVHHHGCDLEQCPVCLGQAITCGCLDDVFDSM